MWSRRLAFSLLASLGLLASSQPHAETVDARLTTLLLLRDEKPLYELLSVSARDIQASFAQDLQLVFSGWGAASIGSNLVWYDTTRPAHNAFGDVDLAYVQGDVLSRSLSLRLGRQLVSGGITRSMQLDGGSVLLRLPAGFGLSAYVGSPVSQRFDARGTGATWNPYQGSFAVGGRASWVLPQWTDVGISVVDVVDRGDPSRRQVGADLRLTPLRPLTLLANTSYDLYESRWADSSVVAQVQALPQLALIADYRHIEPDLMLARNSFLAVFVVERRDEVGGSVQYDLRKAATLVLDFHSLRLEAASPGYRAISRITWRPERGTTLGLEASKLHTSDDDGYFQLRAFGTKKIAPFACSLDVQEYSLTQSVNGQGNSFLATATIGYPIGSGWSAVVSGDGAVTPFYDRRFDLMAKIVYEPTYQQREVHP